MDMLGWQFRLATNDIQTSQIGFFGIAVALLGRNTAVGTVGAALLFGALLNGTSDAQPRPDDLRARAGDEPDLIIQGLDRAVRVSADVIVLGVPGAAPARAAVRIRRSRAAPASGAPSRAPRSAARARR